MVFGSVKFSNNNDDDDDDDDTGQTNQIVVLVPVLHLSYWCRMPYIYLQRSSHTSLHDHMLPTKLPLFDEYGGRLRYDRSEIEIA